MNRPRRAFWLCVAILAFLCIALAAEFGGRTGLEGMLMGLFATSFSLLALWWAIRIGTARPGSAPATRVGTSVIVLAFFVKLPLFIALGTLAHRVGGHAPACFLAGLALVYCALVGWALLQG